MIKVIEIAKFEIYFARLSTTHVPENDISKAL